MVFGVIGILVICFSIYFMHEEGEVSAFGILICFVGVLIVLFGCASPIAGYDKPVVVETQPLYAMEQGNYEQSNIYLIEDVFDTNNENMATTYRYCIEKNGKLEVVEKSRFIKAIICDIKTPVLEKCVIKPKKNIFCFGWLSTTTVYIIRVNLDQVQYRLSP